MIDYRSGWMKTAVLALAATLLALPALADFKEEVARDLGVKNAVLVAPAGSEWLIDLDASSGVQAGDLFAVVAKGTPVVHPVTKKVIGSIDETRALLRVTKVKTGYSYAAVISAQGDLKPGEEARRFAGLPALFWDYAGDGEGVFAQLQGALPELSWQSYAAAQAERPDQPRPVPNMEPGLVFVYNAQGLGVKDHTFQSLRFYSPAQVTGKALVATGGMSSAPAPVGMVAAAAPAGASIVTPGSPAAAAAPGALPGSNSPGMFSGLTKVFSSGSSTPPGPGGVLAGSGGGARGGLIVSQMDNKEGVWYGPRLEGKPVGVDVADFDGDGKNEIALGFGDRVVLARVVAGNFEPLADYALGQSGDLVSLDALDLNGDGRAELYLSVVLMNSVRSQVLELRNGQLEAVIKEVPFFMRKVQLAGEGAVLLGQSLNPDAANLNQDLAGPVFRVTRGGDNLQRGAAIDLPPVVTLFGFQPFDHAGRPLLARLNINDRLQVLEPSGATLWESSDYFGGSEVSFERPDGTAQGAMTRYAFIPPRIEPGPDGSVLVPINEGNRTFSAFRQFNSSHLKSVTYDGYSLVERWRTKPQGGYLGDFRMADADNDGAAEIVMLVMYSRGSWGKVNYGNTVLLIYEMQ